MLVRVRTSYPYTEIHIAFMWMWICNCVCVVPCMLLLERALTRMAKKKKTRNLKALKPIWIKANMKFYTFTTCLFSLHGHWHALAHTFRLLSKYFNHYHHCRLLFPLCMHVCVCVWHLSMGNGTMWRHTEVNDAVSRLKQAGNIHRMWLFFCFFRSIAISIHIIEESLPR